MEKQIWKKQWRNTGEPTKEHNNTSSRRSMKNPQEHLKELRVSLAFIKVKNEIQPKRH